MLNRNFIVKNLEKIVGKENVLHSDAERYCYAYDATNSNRKLVTPDAVVLAQTTQEVSEIAKFASKARR